MHTAANQRRTADLRPRLEGGRVEFVRAEKLSTDLEITWNELRGCDARFASPYYDIEFTRAVARIRNDVEIALFESEIGELIGILPFQRSLRGFAEPIGGRLNDSHSIIGCGGDPSLIARFLKDSNLRSFRFHALANVAEGIEEFEFTRQASYHLDLSNGWEVYHQWARANSVAVKRQPQKMRALERKHGPIRFEFDCTDEAALETLIKLKRSKYRRSRTFDILSVRWAADLLRETHQSSINGFQGLLSVLWAGDEMVAAHYGMLNRDQLHYWFPVFNPKYARFSPGTELILRVAKTVCDLGKSKVDFGYGDDPYKLRFCNGRDSVSCGRIDFNRLAFEVARQQYHWRNRLKRIPLKKPFKSLLRRLYPGFGEWNFK